MNIHFKMFRTLYQMGYFKAPGVRTIGDLDNFLNRRKNNGRKRFERNCMQGD